MRLREIGRTPRHGRGDAAQDGVFFRCGRRRAVGNIDNGLKNEIMSIVAMSPIALDFARCRGIASSHR